MAVRVNAETFAAEVLQAKGLVLVDFYSDSCVPCKRIAPLLSEVAAADPDGLKVVKVNINFDAELAEQYAVQAAPTLVFFQNGAEVARLRGLVKKAELTEVIDSLKYRNSTLSPSFRTVVSNVPLSTKSSLMVTVTYCGVSTFSCSISCATVRPSATSFVTPATVIFMGGGQ